MDKIANYFEKEFNLSVIDKSKLKYSLEVLINEISKLLILLILFSVAGKTKEFIYSLLALITIRPFAGGLHFKSYAGCLVFSGIFFASSMFLNNNIYLASNIPIIFILLIATILFIAPITSENRPVYSKEKLLQFKLISLAIILIHFIAYTILNENSYLNNSIWIFILQSIQLIIKKGVNLYEKKKSCCQKVT